MSIYSYKLLAVVKTGKEIVQIPIRELNIDEYNRCKKACNTLYKVDRKLMFLRMVYWNFNDLKKCEIDYNEHIQSNSFYFDDDYLFNIIRHVHNYLSSVNMFVKQYEANVKRGTPKYFDEFDEHRKDLHFKNVSYRIIWELRNELQHSKMPDINIKFVKNSKNYFEMKIYIKKDYLLSIDKLKRDNEVKHLDNNVDLFKHSNNMNKCLNELARDVFLNELKEIMEDYVFLKNLVNEIHIDGEPCIEKSYNGIKPEYTMINIRLIDFIENLIRYGERTEIVSKS
jgi:hypothetical protein